MNSHLHEYDDPSQKDMFYDATDLSSDLSEDIFITLLPLSMNEKYTDVCDLICEV